jgi:hypothetical protein
MRAFGSSNKRRLLRTAFNNDRIPDGTEKKKPTYLGSVQPIPLIVESQHEGN